MRFSDVPPVLIPPATVPIDLEAVFRATADLRACREATKGQFRRVVEMVESSVRDTAGAAPLKTAGYLDGIQVRRLLCRIDHRDVTLIYLAAGAVAGTAVQPDLRALQARLVVACSHVDEAQVARRLPGVPLVVLDEHYPWAVAAATDEWVDTTRRSLEIDAIASAPAHLGAALVVDGALPASASRLDLVGVIKSALETEWLSDPAQLPVLGGWRSPAFRLPAMRRGERSRLSAYVRLRSASPSDVWGHALVRVEVLEGGIVDLDSACQLAHRFRGNPGSDPRYLVQLDPMHLCENVLKMTVPTWMRVTG